VFHAPISNSRPVAAEFKQRCRHCPQHACQPLDETSVETGRSNAPPDEPAGVAYRRFFVANYLPVNHLRVNLAERAATSSRHPRVAKRTCPYAISRVFHVVVQKVSHSVVTAANNILGGIYSLLWMYTFAGRRVVLVFVERQDAPSCPCSTYIMGQNLLAA
jgi:hypothetical protein